MRFKAVLLTVAMISALLSFSACGNGNSLKINGSPASRDGVTVNLNKASAVRKTKPDRYEYSFSGTIENNSDEGIMKVIYAFSLENENGEVFRSFAEIYDGEEKAIPPHSSIAFSHDDIKWGAQSVPASVSIRIGSVFTEDELPPARLLKAGDYLFEVLGDDKLADIKKVPPVELSFHVDQGGYGRTATFEKGVLLDRAIELLCDIRIAGETNESVTDNYNWICLTWEDGSCTCISLNLRNLEYNVHSSPHYYELENLNSFWNFAADYLIEDE